MSDDHDHKQEDVSAHLRSLATIKLNFIAWAFRNDKKVKLGAVDLMVLAQLIVRYDPERGPFAMSAERLAHCTGTAVSSVRRALSRLEELGDIRIIPNPGHSSLYKIRFHVAEPNWITYQRRRYKKMLDRRNGLTPPTSDRMPKSGKEPAKMLQGGLPKSGHSPSQNPSAVSISSNHQDIHISPSMRPDGRDEENHMRPGGRISEDDGAKGNSSSRTGGNRLLGDDDAFNRFVSVWPKPDRDLGKLKAAWSKRVIKAGHDPEYVIDMAKEWHLFHLSDPDRNEVPYAGKWLSESGWERQPPTPAEPALDTSAFESFVTKGSKLEAESTRSWRWRDDDD